MEWINQIIQGNTLDILKQMPDDFVDCIITSPPYWGLRDYGEETKIIWDGDENCEHEWIPEDNVKDNLRFRPGKSTNVGNFLKEEIYSNKNVKSAFCYKCGAWYGQLGLEPTLDLYLEHLLQITTELKRILKPSGILWWNHGDSYCGSQGHFDAKNPKAREGKLIPNWENYPKKCLYLQNFRLIIRMIDEQGWILRNTIIWHKLNHMPSCLSPDTEVYIKSKNGVIDPYSLGDVINCNIEKLQILTPFGWKKIKNIWKVKKSEYIKFLFGSSGEVICSLDHKFPISHDNRRRNYEIKLAWDLREDKHKLLDRLLFVPIGKFLDGEYKEINNQKLDYELGKFIGLIIAEGGFNGEGTNQGKITLNKNEKDLMRFFTDVLKKRFNQYFKIYYKDNYQFVQFSSEIIKSLYQRLVLGKCTTKSLDKVYLLNSPFEFRQGLFDGIIAGDGHIDENGRITYGTASKQLRDDVYLLASSIGLLASKYKSYKRYDKRTGKIYTSYFLTIPLSLQKEFLKGERIQCRYWNKKTKTAIPNVYQNSFSCKTLKVSNIEKIKQEKELIDIEVEGGLFLINGGLVSHNSVKDRFTNAYEPVFMLVKNKKYAFDLDVVRTPWEQTSIDRLKYPIALLGDPITRRPLLSNKRILLNPNKYKHTHYPQDQAENFGSPRARYWRELKEIQKYSGSPGRRSKLVLLEGKLTTKVKKELLDIGNYLKQKLKEANLNVQKLAELTGLKETTIAHYFRTDFSGQALPDKNTWDILKAILNLGNYEDFINEEIRNALPNPHPLGKNPGDLWPISTQPFKDSHFAVFPEKLIEPMILAGCPKNGIVLDPFMGSGTVGVVAKRLGRNWIGIELNPKYIEMAQKRIGNTFRQEELFDSL